MLDVSCGEVPSSEISVVDSITVDWVMAPRNWGFNLKSNSTNYTDHGHHVDPLPTRKNSHGRAGNRTRDLVVSSQKLWPPDHEAGLFFNWEFRIASLEALTAVWLRIPFFWDVTLCRLMIILRRFEFLTIVTWQTNFQVTRHLIPKEQLRQHSEFYCRKPV